MMYDLLGARAKVLKGALIAGDTSITFTHPLITEDSLIDIYNDQDGVVCTSRSVSGNTLTLTYEPIETDLNIRVKVGV